jgi:hypothetical protein
VGLEEKCGEERHDGVRELLEAIDVNVDEVEAKVGGGIGGSGELRQSSSCWGWRRRCAACGKKAMDGIRTEATDGIRTESADSTQPVARAGETVFCTYEAIRLVFLDGRRFFDLPRFCDHHDLKPYY